MKKKVLFFTTPAYGHINSVLPIVERLVNKDYQVICYSSKEYKQIIEETGAKYIEYKIDFNADDFGLIYGIDIDGSVKFYLDNKLLIEVTDTLDPDVDSLDGVQNCELYRSDIDSNITLIFYNQTYELDTDEYTAYNSLIMIIDSLASGIDYAE